MPSQTKPFSPQKLILLGIVTIATGLLAYYYIGTIERNGGTLRTNPLIVLAYNAMGRTGVLGLFMAFGGFMLWSGSRGLAERDQAEPLARVSE